MDASPSLLQPAASDAASSAGAVDRARTAVCSIACRTGWRQGVAMKIGIAMFPTDYSITPGELAQAAEERGFESLWFPEHTHIPTSRKSPWPGGPDLPEVVQANARSVHGADRRRDGDEAHQARHRHLPGGRARPDPHRQERRHPRLLSAAAASSSASAADGTPRRWPTTAPPSRRASR